MQRKGTWVRNFKSDYDTGPLKSAMRALIISCHGNSVNVLNVKHFGYESGLQANAAWSKYILRIARFHTVYREKLIVLDTLNVNPIYFARLLPSENSHCRNTCVMFSVTLERINTISQKNYAISKQILITEFAELTPSLSNCNSNLSTEWPQDRFKLLRVFLSFFFKTWFIQLRLRRIRYLAIMINISVITIHQKYFGRKTCCVEWLINTCS